MENLETYNRVRSLESPLYKSSVLIGNILFISIAIGASVSFWLLNTPWHYSLGITALAICASTALTVFNHRRAPSCQFCGNNLSFVVRPFLLNSKYLSMQGHKKGDYFYTRCSWGYKPLLKRWAKISHRSLACHHCRLTEEKQSEHYEPVSTDERATL